MVECYAALVGGQRAECPQRCWEIEARKAMMVGVEHKELA